MLRVTSFNLRYDEPGDGADGWLFRRDMVAETLSRLNPHVAGVQEPEMHQLRYLKEVLQGWHWFGTGRFADDSEKFTAILYGGERLRLLESGAFWLSATPDVPASMSWQIHKPYAINWGRFRQPGTDQEFTLFNSHFPYKPSQQEARLRSAELLAQRASGAAGPVILTGDFNSPADGDVYRILTGAGFADARLAAEVVEGPAGTMHGFTGEAPAERRIDWVLLRGFSRVRRFETVTFGRDGRFPSDHFPVTADLEW
jgi:endonuclease/exonuclease/phosphatase family metal-dependent hydrolase